MSTIAVTVPGSTTNLGHGFDCLGIALGLANTVSVTPGGETVTAPDAPDGGLAAMAAQVRDACASAWGVRLPGFSVRIAGTVPVARGMGSSATILLGVAAACQRLAGRAFDRGELLPIAAAIEGHPDNVAAACFGGVTVVGQVGDRLRWSRIAVPAGLTAVVAVPPFEVKTSEARRILPQELSRKDAITGLQRTALITAALAQGDLDALRGVFADAWHERYRAPLNRGFVEARAAADAAGAIGTIISGSGSTVLAFARVADAERVRLALQASYDALGIAGARMLIPGFDADGVRLG